MVEPKKKTAKGANPKRETEKAAKVATPRDPKRETELIEMVRAARDDDSPRLVYADWLLEHGDPRGEFIQVQCALGRALSSKGTPRLFTDYAIRESEKELPPDHVELEKREAALFRKHGKTWIEPFRPFISRAWSWRGGFVESIHTNPVFFDGAERVLDAHPVSLLLLEGMRPVSGSHQRLAETSLRGIRQLNLDTQDIAGPNLAAVLQKNLSEIEFLNIAGNGLGDAGAVKLATESHLTSLRALRVDRCGIGDAGLAALATSPVLRNLETLFFANNQLTDDGLLAFARECTLPKLKVVKVGEGTWSEAALAAVGERFTFAPYGA